MYNVALVNLAPDARSVATNGIQLDRPELSEAEMRALLLNFCELDRLENATADPEIRVRTGHEQFLIRTGNKKIILYDMLNREHAGLTFNVDEVMAELNGSAAANRTRSPFGALRPSANTVATPMQPAIPLNKPRLIALATLAVVLAGALVLLHAPVRDLEVPTGFARIDAVELPELHLALAGVYLTGNKPGSHGIALTSTGDLKLFELAEVDAPRVVQARYELGRTGMTLCLSTDQPGGSILMTDADTFVYSGETYQRVR